MSEIFEDQSSTRTSAAQQATLAYLKPVIDESLPIDPLSQVFEIDCNDPEALVGAAAAVIEAGVPEVGRIASLSTKRTLEVLDKLSTPEASAVLEQNGLTASAKLSQLASAMFGLAEGSSPDSEFEIVRYKSPYEGPEAVSQALRDLMDLSSQSSVELVAHGSSVEVLAKAQAFRRAQRGPVLGLSRSESITQLPDETYKQAAKSIVDNNQEPTTVARSLNALIATSLQDGKETNPAVILAEALQLPEAELGVYFESYLDTSKGAQQAYIGAGKEYTEQLPDGRVTLDLERLFDRQTAHISVKAQDLLARSRSIGVGDRPSVHNFVKTSIRLFDTIGEHGRRLDTERLILDLAGEVGVDQSRLYEVEQLGSVTYTDPLSGKEQTRPVTRESLKLPEVNAQDSDEEKLGILCGITSKTRRVLMQGNAAQLAQEATLAQQLVTELADRNPWMQEALVCRLTDHFTALGGAYVSQAENVLGQAKSESSRAQLGKSLEVAQALSDSSLSELVALQAAELTKDSKPTTYDVTPKQAALAEKLIEKSKLDETIVTLLIDDPEVLVDILLGDGRIKTMWETRTTAGVTGGDILEPGDWSTPSYLENRTAAEQTMGLADHIQHPGILEPPVSALTMVPRRTPASAGSYGFIELGLKNEAVRDRTVFVDGDSANEALKGKPQFMDWDDAIKTAAEKAVLVRDGVIQPTRNSAAPPKGWDYVEALVLGGVKKDDIGTVTIRTRDFITEEEALKLRDQIVSRVEGVVVEVAR